MCNEGLFFLLGCLLGFFFALSVVFVVVLRISHTFKKK